jgi:hypothetical protein
MKISIYKIIRSIILLPVIPFILLADLLSDEKGEMLKYYYSIYE